jgi:serine/threonine protein kinase
VLELVDGVTLAERIALGPIPLTDVLTLATQIADALDAAHERGIVHRDLKPANVKISTEGRVKVLDFGLAKVVDDGELSTDLTHSPTITEGATRQGVLLGTVAYMSPEQARGFAVDKRTDLWAFGCVLYEMLTGRAAFARATVTDSLAAIVESEPDWSTLPARTPPSVRRILERCLEKNSKRRIRDVGDVRTELLELAAALAKRPSGTYGNEAGRSLRSRALIPVIVGIGLMLAGAAAWILFYSRPSAPSLPPRMEPITAFSDFASSLPCHQTAGC